MTSFRVVAHFCVAFGSKILGGLVFDGLGCRAKYVISKIRGEGEPCADGVVVIFGHHFRGPGFDPRTRQ